VATKATRAVGKDPEALRQAAAEIITAFNATAPREEKRRNALLGQLLGTWNGAVVRPPFTVTMGANIHFEEACFVNEGCAILDACDVRIGSFTQLAPRVRILTETGPGTADPAAAPKRGPVKLGRNVWVGAGAEIHPGVTVGDDVIISAGAVVREDVPAGATYTGGAVRPPG